MVTVFFFFLFIFITCAPAGRLRNWACPIASMKGAYGHAKTLPGPSQRGLSLVPAKGIAYRIATTRLYLRP
uniref:Putative secreted protein n=1 Tax=Ixodes ricinus TaxID=34613 RepID=A0A6B0TXK3_IXORI